MSFDDLQFELGVGTQCGQCESCAREVHAQCACAGPVAALHRETETVKESREWPQSSSVAA